jgi:hypothetical protein
VEEGMYFMKFGNLCACVKNASNLVKDEKEVK